VLPDYSKRSDSTVAVKWLQRLPAGWRAPLMQLGFNLHPAYRTSGGRVEYVSPDLLHMRVRLNLNRRTRNVFGTLFGGSLFSVTDGPLPTMLMAALGPDVVVWDQEARIQFLVPGRTTLYADFRITPEELATVRAALALDGKVRRTYTVELKDEQGIVHTIVERTVYIADKARYKSKTIGEEAT
jgi:acyl-coenzyme A thioesterase PaaI-like protein